MKKFLLSITLTLGMLLGFSNSANSQTTWYSTIDVFNANGVNATDFVFSYDNGNTCMNNFKVVNNLAVATWFNFKIFINGVWMYTGYVEIASYGSVYFNNAFTNCNSSRGVISIRTW